MNEHTAEGFAFFAVKLRVVRIGNSPYAPIFEIAEKPNDWDREIKQKTVSEGAAYYDLKQAFWTEFLARRPDFAALGFQPWRYSNNYIELQKEPQVQLSFWIGKTSTGVFVRSAWGEPAEPVAELLAPHAREIEAALGAPLTANNRQHFLVKSTALGHADRAKWDKIIDWIVATADAYRAVLNPILQRDL